MNKKYLKSVLLVLLLVDINQITNAGPIVLDLNAISTKYKLKNDIPLRIQWDANSGYCGEVSMISAGLYYGQYLSQYDVIYQLPFSIPLNYGDHISLFTITAVITSFLISIYNMAMTPDQNNPMLKYMPYIFPFVLLFVFNRLPSALTWYYTVSNVITLIIQLVIQKYIIDHDKILAQIDLKRKTPKTKSKWQQKYDEMLESQKKLKNLKK